MSGRQTVLHPVGKVPKAVPVQFMSTAAHLRLLSDLKAISREPPDGCSASPVSDDNLYVWVRGALLDHLCAQPSRHVARMEGS